MLDRVEKAAKLKEFSTKIGAYGFILFGSQLVLKLRSNYLPIAFMLYHEVNSLYHYQA